MALTVYSDDQQVDLNYTLENNINPTNDFFKNLLKRMYFSQLYNRGYNNSGTGGDNQLGVLSYAMPNYFICPNMFSNGHIKLRNENNEIVGISDLFYTYSGTDVKRGTININESSMDITEDVYHYKITVDFPTSVANGTIKKIEFYPYPYYTTAIKPIPVESFYNNTSQFSNYYYNSVHTLITSINNNNNYNNQLMNNFKAIYMENNENAYISDIYKNLKYKGKKYKFTDMYACRVFYLNDKFYYLTSWTPTLITITELKLNDETLEIETTENIIELDMSNLSTLNNTNISDWYSIALFYRNGHFNFIASSDPSCLSRGIMVTFDENNKASKASIYDSHSIFYYLLRINQIANKDIIEMYYDYSNTNYHMKIDLVNDTIVIDHNVDDMPEDNYMINKSNNIMYNSYCVYHDGKKYTTACINGNQICLVDMGEKIKPSLIYTLTDPIVKTDKQTMKLQFDIEIS